VRNNVRVFFTKWTNDPANGKSGTAIGENQDLANATALQLAALSSPASTDLQPLGLFYVNLDRATILGYFSTCISGGPSSNVPGNDVGSRLLTNIQGVTQAFGLDEHDPPPRDWSVFEGKETGAAKKGGKTKVVPPETLLQSLLTFAGALVAEGYRTGGRPNLLTKLVAFILLIKNNKPYDHAALGVLLGQISAFAHFSG
jgi:hypothetical protein